MFCYSENCKGEHSECSLVKVLNTFTLDFKPFNTKEDIEIGKDILCLVTSWEEPPYFIVLIRYEDDIYNAFDNEPLENTKILKWAYLPENVL